MRRGDEPFWPMTPEEQRAYEQGKGHAENRLAWRAWWIAAGAFGALGYLLRGIIHGGG